MIRTIADFAPDDTESGVELVIQNNDGRYLFFLAGDRHHCPLGELFYAGIGGHREVGEDWTSCAHREAKEEIGVDIEIRSSTISWHIPEQGPIERVEIRDRPKPYILYEMIHPPGAPRAGKSYRVVIFKARLHDMPGALSPDEVKGIIAMTREQVIQGLDRKPLLTDLLAEGALLLAGEKVIARRVRLYPLGTAKALSLLLRQIVQEDLRDRPRQTRATY